MDLNSTDGLQSIGFRGFATIRDLWCDKSSIPKEMGVYLVLNPTYQTTLPQFLAVGVGGFFKGKDPNIDIPVLQSNFVPDSLIVYIGKAGGPGKKATLHSRIGQYLGFGQGKNIGHQGGRYIWQLENHADLMFCWKPTPDDDPREIEKQLIGDYTRQFARKPFANLAS